MDTHDLFFVTWRKGLAEIVRLDVACNLHISTSPMSDIREILFLYSSVNPISYCEIYFYVSASEIVVNVFIEESFCNPSIKVPRLFFKT